MSAATESKAARLLADGKVDPLPVSAQIFRVDGDTGIWFVTVSASIQLCTCPSTTRCSHLEAAVNWVLADDEQRVENEQALEARKATDRVLADDAFARCAA